MRLGDERTAIVRAAQRLGPDGLTIGTAGNISVRANDTIAITPSGVDSQQMDAADIVLLDTDGEVVDGTLKPSSELQMHLAIFRATRAAAIVHTHSPHATALSALVDQVPPVHYLIVMLGTNVRTAPYETPGSEALATRVAGALGDSYACLLQNHGAVTVGDSLERAYERSLLLEWLCALYARARSLGDPRLLSATELRRAAEALHDYGA